MTNKKQRTTKAKTLRNTVKGITLPQSIQLVKNISDEFKFLDLLKSYGFAYDYIVTGYCPSDGAPEGHYDIFKKFQLKGKIPFNCCGIYIIGGEN